MRKRSALGAWGPGASGASQIAVQRSSMFSDSEPPSEDPEQAAIASAATSRAVAAPASRTMWDLLSAFVQRLLYLGLQLLEVPG